MNTDFTSLLCVTFLFGKQPLVSFTRLNEARMQRLVTAATQWVWWSGTGASLSSHLCLAQPANVSVLTSSTYKCFMFAVK